MYQPVNSINATRAIPARVAVAFVDVYFAVDSRCARSTNTLIAIDAILAPTTELTRIAFAFVDLRLTKIAREAEEATAGERVLPVDASSTVARIRLAIVDVGLARCARESWRTVASVFGDRILTGAAVSTR